MNVPQALLFDLDGVLIDSRDAWFHTLVRAGRTFGGGRIPRAAFEATFGQGTQAEIEQHHLRCSVDELNAFFLETFPQFLSEVATDPEALPLLRALSARGIRCAVTTNTVSGLAQQILQGNGLAPFFAQVLCADEVERAKPAPDLLIEALRRVNVPAAQAWMVGDSRYDAEAAAAARVHFLGFRRAGDLRIETLSAIEALVARPAP